MHPIIERLLLVAGLSGVYALYWPINYYTARAPAHDLTLPIDRLTPLAPAWLYVYAALFVSSYLPVLLVRDRALFRRIAVAVLALELVSLATFLIFPVRYALRPEVLAPIDSLATWGMHFMCWLDEPVNCFPSLHVGAATLAAASCWKADRRVAVVGGVMAALVGASTMLVKQHYLADVLAAGALVGVLYAAVIAPFDVGDRSPEEMRYDPRLLLLAPLSYGLLLGLMALLYAVDWAPWRPAG